MYSGGKFDLGSLLASVPGRIMRGLSGLVSGLLGSEEEEHPVMRQVRSAAKRYLPSSLTRQIRESPEETED
ncbi:MAG: hypothetical protein NZZ41_08210 [Candidatus Dojkabacteria bacterium]|nr:hypothetical protein [Candidatus Dojkabacteria bacterium]